ncbi:MAG TPA: glycosyltransferase family 4 protein [Gemmatimonadaceae bacterium]|nr:glycosyltransferase family 4 protein [Gemmatimonadaceae bacterium]
MSGPKPRRILMLAPLAPWPANNGAKVRMFHLARLLSRRHAVTLLVLAPEGQGVTDPLATALPGVEVRVVPSAARSPRPMRAIQALVGRQPLHVSEAWNPRMAAAVAEESRRPFDVLHVFHMTMAQYVTYAKAPLLVYDPMGHEALYMERMIASAPRLWAPFLKANLRRVRRYEAWATSRFDAVVAVSDLEAAYFRQAARPDALVATIPIAPDTNQLLALEATGADRPVVLFTGSLDWFPNIDAARYLVQQIWPLVIRARPDAELWLAGKDPAPDVRELARAAGVSVVANPDSMLPLLRDAAVVAVPIRTGSGTKIKTVEAMAAGKAIVTTTLGCEGWDVADGTHVRRADGPEEFARALVALLGDPAERARMGTAARNLVRQRYTADGMVERFEALYTAGLARAGAA